jgi:N-acetylneuraminic acid mutarotase
VVALAACGEPHAISDAPSAWRSGPALPSRRLEPGVTALGDRLVVAGGFDTSIGEGLHTSMVVDVLDSQTDTWLAPLPPLPVAWTHIDLASSGGTLYLLGGLESAQFRARGETFALDADATAWRPLATMPVGFERGAAGVVATATHIYLLGGASTTDAIATCLDYDIAADRWSELPALPLPRSHPAAMQTSDGTLLVAAGLQSLDSTQPLGDVLALAPGAASWQRRDAVLASLRGGCAYGVLGGELVCAGGEAARSALHVVDSYDPATDRWRSLDALPADRAGTQGAAIGTRFFVPGGAAKLVYEPTDTLFVYTP